MIERCTDYRRIKKFPDWRVLVSSEVYYLMEVKDGVDLGVWTLHPWLSKYDEGVLLHASLGDGCRGKDARDSAQNVFSWIFANTNHRCIYAAIPDDKRHAQFMAVQAGMKYEYRDNTKRYYRINWSQAYEARRTVIFHKLDVERQERLNYGR